MTAKRKPTTYDPHCLELAQYFLRDMNDRYPGRERNDEEEAEELASRIQAAVEDYLAELEEGTA